MKTRLFLVRHGETEWNKLGKFQGQLDSPLTEQGIKQAKAVSKALAAESIHHIYSSDLGRAVNTASIIAEPHRLQVVQTEDLRERNLGVFQGLNKASIEKQYPEHARRYHSHDPDHVIPQGESARDRYERSTACFQRLGGQHRGETILVVTHGGVLRGIFEMVLDLPLNQRRRFSLYNASIARFGILNDHWMMESWGETGHLQQSASDDV